MGAPDAVPRLPEALEADADLYQALALQGRVANITSVSERVVQHAPPLYAAPVFPDSFCTDPGSPGSPCRSPRSFCESPSPRLVRQTSQRLLASGILVELPQASAEVEHASLLETLPAPSPPRQLGHFGQAVDQLEETVCFRGSSYEAAGASLDDTLPVPAAELHATPQAEEEPVPAVWFFDASTGAVPPNAPPGGVVVVPARPLGTGARLVLGQLREAHAVDVQVVPADPGRAKAFGDDAYRQGGAASLARWEAPQAMTSVREVVRPSAPAAAASGAAAPWGAGGATAQGAAHSTSLASTAVPHGRTSVQVSVDVGGGGGSYGVAAPSAQPCTTGVAGSVASSSGAGVVHRVSDITSVTSVANVGSIAHVTGITRVAHVPNVVSITTTDASGRILSVSSVGQLSSVNTLATVTGVTNIATVSAVPSQNLQVHPAGHDAYERLVRETELPLLRHPGDLGRAYMRFCEANAIHTRLYGKPSGDAFFSMACCLSLGAATDALCPSGPELPPVQSGGPGELAEARLDLSVNMLQSAALSGFSAASRLVFECSLQAVREHRPEQFAAVLQRVPGGSALMPSVVLGAGGAGSLGALVGGSALVAAPEVPAAADLELREAVAAREPTEAEDAEGASPTAAGGWGLSWFQDQAPPKQRAVSGASLGSEGDESAEGEEDKGHERRKGSKSKVSEAAGDEEEVEGEEGAEGEEGEGGSGESSGEEEGRPGLLKAFADSFKTFKWGW